MIVQSKAENTNTNLQDVNANVLLINTYKDMILGDVVINDVQRELEQNYGQSLTKGGVEIGDQCQSITKLTNVPNRCNCR